MSGAEEVCEPRARRDLRDPHNVIEPHEPWTTNRRYSIVTSSEGTKQPTETPKEITRLSIYNVKSFKKKKERNKILKESKLPC